MTQRSYEVGDDDSPIIHRMPESVPNIQLTAITKNAQAKARTTLRLRVRERRSPLTKRLYFLLVELPAVELHVVLEALATYAHGEIDLLALDVQPGLRASAIRECGRG